MDAKTCLAMLRDIRDAAFATVDEDGRPRARIIDVMLVEGEKLYFCTARGKAFYRQLLRDNRVAVVGMNRQYQMVRLEGEAAKVPEQAGWIDRIFRENPSMEDVYPGDSRCILEAFCIQRGRLEFFDLGAVPVFRQTFALGAGGPEPGGFAVTEACVGCGACREACPQGCIEEGTPYRICQEHCLHCGRCVEVCPASCIVGREA